jgi:diguanylate cyclase (GGDEF)-like protein
MSTGAAPFPDDPKPLVLIIDDSEDVHRLLRERLKHEETQFAGARSGPEGLAAAVRLQPALVLLDLDLPGLSGFEVLRRLKDMTTTQQVPVIVLSANTQPEDKVTAFELGAVDFITKPFEFTELQVRVRSALRLHQLVQMLSQKAQIDGLTGLWNRALFDRRMGEEFARSVRHGHALSLAMIDIDHFKAVNDTFGHPAGDLVLHGIAKVLQRAGRASDLACRYGGEEFALVMPDTAPADAARLCERIRAEIEAMAWPRLGGRVMTVSIGVAGMHGRFEGGADALIETADRNLYAAKRGGRNCVVTTDLSSPASPGLRYAR